MKMRIIFHNFYHYNIKEYCPKEAGDENLIWFVLKNRFFLKKKKSNFDLQLSFWFPRYFTSHSIELRGKNISKSGTEDRQDVVRNFQIKNSFLTKVLLENAYLHIFTYLSAFNCCHSRCDKKRKTSLNKIYLTH